MRARSMLPVVILAACGGKEATEAAPPVEPAEPAATVTPPSWPFAAWDRAEAIRFNTDQQFGPGIPLRVYDAEHGWSPHITERVPISEAQAARALEWVAATRGEIEVSKCPFPRHAIVYYVGDAPVGSVNVCFQCGDVLVWPPFEAEPDYDDPAWEKLYETKLAGYEIVFPKWEAFFSGELGWSIEPPPRP